MGVSEGEIMPKDYDKRPNWMRAEEERQDQNLKKEGPVVIPCFRCGNTKETKEGFWAGGGRETDAELPKEACGAWFCGSRCYDLMLQEVKKNGAARKKRYIKTINGPILLIEAESEINPQEE